MLPTDQLAVILPTLTSIVGRIQPGQLDDPTPCRNFAVRDVIEHMISGAEAFAPVFRGTAPDAGTPAEPSTDAHPSARFRAAMAELLDATQSPGALTRTVDSPFGRMDGDTFARLVAFDGLIHGWDLATSTGQGYDPPEEVTNEVDAFARAALTPELRDGDTFAAETEGPEGANTLLRLVAFSGRSVT